MHEARRSGVVQDVRPCGAASRRATRPIGRVVQVASCVERAQCRMNVDVMRVARALHHARTTAGGSRDACMHAPIWACNASRTAHDARHDDRVRRSELARGTTVRQTSACAGACVQLRTPIARRETWDKESQGARKGPCSSAISRAGKRVANVRGRV